VLRSPAYRRADLLTGAQIWSFEKGFRTIYQNDTPCGQVRSTHETHNAFVRIVASSQR
jgi:hypothetical protein